MKKRSHKTKLGLIAFWTLLSWYMSAMAQDPHTGIWEGDFMEQFKTVILIDRQADAGYTGKILMYSGESRIQDDELTEISIGKGTIGFHIAAKETSFRGSFNESATEISGDLIFPDGSRYPLHVRKYEKDREAAEKDAPGLKEMIRQSIPVEDLKSDFRELVRKLKEYHPRLYSHTSEPEFRRDTEEILESLKADMSLEEYYCMIAPLVASVGCSHTGIKLPGDYRRLLDEKGRFFPLDLYLSGLSASCLSAPALPDTDLVPGMDILTINQRPVPQIIDTLLALIPAEGNCKTTRYQALNRDFPHYFHLLDPSERFTIEYASAGKRGSLQLEAVPLGSFEITETRAAHDPSFRFRLSEDPQMGILSISSFGIRNMDAYFFFLDSAFRILRQNGIPDLVLDLRDNQGGHPIFAAQLLSYLTDSEITYFKRNPDVQEFEPLYGPMEPNEMNFTGSLYVLVNGNCLSTTGHLLSLLDYHTGAQFIGEEPGSSYTCNDNSIQVKLPHTGLEVNIPRTTFITAVQGNHPGDPFPVDYSIPVTAGDLLNNRDSYMSFTKDLVRKKRS